VGKTLGRVGLILFSDGGRDVGREFGERVYDVVGTARYSFIKGSIFTVVDGDNILGEGGSSYCEFRSRGKAKKRKGQATCPEYAKR